MTDKTDRSKNTEWEVFVNAAKIHPRGQTHALEAPENVRQSIAQRVEVRSVDYLHAECALEKDGAGRRIKVSGQINAQVTQDCVVTKEPITSGIHEIFETFFADDNAAISFVRARNDHQLKKHHVEVPMLEEHEDPEPLENGYINLGEVVTQFFSLAVPDFPKQENARHDVTDEDKNPDERGAAIRRNPFQALEKWREGLDDDEL